jgi:uncharacterized membrane protein YgdD (TMEM256/DUF423 family)
MKTFNHRSWHILVILTFAFGIILGALGAHKLKSLLTPEALESFKTGVFYQLTQCIALLWLIDKAKENSKLRLSVVLAYVGMTLFSFSIFLLSTQQISGISFHWLGPITPLGGLCMITSWILVAIRLGRQS